jgi:hypothetical protein
MGVVGTRPFELLGDEPLLLAVKVDGYDRELREGGR